jgi:hypothetical protein
MIRVKIPATQPGNCLLWTWSRICSPWPLASVLGVAEVIVSLGRSRIKVNRAAWCYGGPTLPFRGDDYSEAMACSKFLCRFRRPDY